MEILRTYFVMTEKSIFWICFFVKPVDMELENSEDYVPSCLFSDGLN